MEPKEDFDRLGEGGLCLNCSVCTFPNCGFGKVSMSSILTYEQIVRICRVASMLGIRKIKITGGEPFVRLGCTGLIRELKGLDGIDQVTVTTNGQTLRRYIDELKDIGIDGINISLDTTDPEKFKYITGGTGFSERDLHYNGALHGCL